MNCGAPNAPLGYSRKGTLRRLPEKLRTRIFVCPLPDCVARAEAWKRRADGEITTARPPAPSTPEPAANPAPPPAQGQLF